MSPNRTIYRVYDSDLRGSPVFRSESEAREYASELNEAVIIRKQQFCGKSTGWEDERHEFIRKDFDHPFFNEVCGGVRVQ